MTSQNTSRRDFFLVATASVSWGTVGLANQIMYNISSANALSLAFWRLCFSVPLFLLPAWLLLRRDFLRIKLRDLGIMAIMGALQGLYQLCYSASIPAAGVIVSTLIAICVAPVIVALVSTFMMRERISRMTLLALVGALGGTILLVAARSDRGAANVSFYGILLALLAATGYAAFILCGQRFSRPYNSFQINAIAFGTGTLFLLIFASSSKLIINYSAWGWLILFYLGAIPTALGYGLFQIGMRSLSATVTSIITLIEPLAAALLAWIFLGEQLTPLGFLGSGLLIAAMALILLYPGK